MEYTRNRLQYAQPDMKIKRENNYNAHIQVVNKMSIHNLCFISCVLMLFNVLNICYLN